MRLVSFPPENIRKPGVVAVNNRPINSSLTKSYQRNLRELDPRSMGSKPLFIEERKELKL